jgi:P4 family phage/plasmid primase-like protien
MDSISLDELKERRQWLVWRSETGAGSKPTKVPYSPLTGHRTGSDEPHRSEWTTYDEATACVSPGGFSGVGVVLTDGLNGIDIDHRSLQDEVTKDVLSKVCSYAERSPFGDGLHILFSVDTDRLPADFIPTYGGGYYKKNNENGIECYLPSISGSRYFTFTGDAVVGLPINDCTEGVLEFLDAYMRRPEPIARTQMTSAPNRAGAALTDDEVIAKALAARNGDKFARLWQGDTSDHNDDDSAADLALCSHLAFWCKGDTAQMDRLFRQSRLMRGKWDRDDYREPTLSKALEGITEFYNPAAPRPILRDGLGEVAIIGGLVEKLDSLSDDGFSDLFVKECGHRIRHSEALGWLVWSGRVWKQSNPEAQELFKEFAAWFETDVKSLHTSTGATRTEAQWDDDKERERWAKGKQDYLRLLKAFAKSMRTHNKIAGCMKLASSAVNVTVEELDNDPYLLNTPSGTVNLKTGELLPHDPAYYCTKATKYATTDNTDASMWDSLLSLISCGDDELVEYLQYIAGMALVGKTYVEAAFIAYGGGANGKSTFFNALYEVLGSYSGKLPADALMSTGRSARFDLAGLLGKRLVIASETEEGQRLSNAMLKQIASTDTITAEEKYKSRFEFAPSFTVVLYTNFLPKVPSSDNGTWRRLKVIPFNATIANPEHDYLERLLRQSGGAILRWAIEGACRFIANNLKLPQCGAVEKAIKEYQADNDWLSHFIEECCIVEPATVCKASDLYERYRNHATETGEYPRNSRDFKAALEERSFTHRRAPGGGGNQWVGIEPRREGGYW